MPRGFVPFPDPRLRAVAEPVAEVDDAVRAIWEEMLAAMYGMPGVGLAAPQLGIGLRLAVVDCSDSRDEPLRLANPVLLSASEVMRKGPEASPNLPGFVEDVERPIRTTVRFLNASGDQEEREFSGLWSTSVQHQIDHLNGKMFFDRIPPLRRRRLLAKARKGRK